MTQPSRASLLHVVTMCRLYVETGDNVHNAPCGNVHLTTDGLLHRSTSIFGFAGFGYSSSSGTEEEEEDGHKDDEDELSESDEDAERVWERIRRKRSEFDRRMQVVDDSHRGKHLIGCYFVFHS